MKMKNALLSLTLILLLAFISSCSDDSVTNPPNPNDTELITTLIVNLRDSVTGATSSFEFDDPDGEGGNAPVRMDSITIESDKVYFCDLLLLDRSSTPVDTISNEVEEEGVDHQFFFNIFGLNAVIDYDDADANGNPIGLKTIWRTGGNSSGVISIVLKHQPGTKPPAPGNQNIGETDVAVDFTTFIN